MNQKNQRGITLIALVVTIIILLILAGVTINMVLGNDGIIAQAQQAKETQEKKEKEEQDELDKGAGNIDLYKEGSLASNVKVGDYVEYKYVEKEYTTPEVGTGNEVNDTTQTFSSKIATQEGEEDGNAAVLNWRVLSKKNGIVKLIADYDISKEWLTLRSTMGYVNGPTVLNNMCAALYSSDIAKEVRSINVDDVNEITRYDGTKYYIEQINGTNVEKAMPNGKTTIGDLENDETLNLKKLDNRTTPDGRLLEEYEVNFYAYNILDDEYENKWLTKDNEEYKLLFGTVADGAAFGNYHYWLASHCVHPTFNMDNSFVKFHIRAVGSGQITARQMFSSKGNIRNSDDVVRPIVILKTGLEVDGGDGKQGSPWIIKTATE